MTDDAPRGRLAVAILFLAALTSVVSGTLLSPLLPAIAADLDVSVATAGQLGTAGSIVGVVVALVAMPWMDRVPRSRWLRGQSVLLAVAATLCALAPSFAWLAAGRMLAGLGGSLVLANCLSAAGDYFPDSARRNRAVGVIVSAAALGIVAGLPIIAQIEELAGWRWAIASPLPLLALVCGTTWLLPTETTGRSAAADGSVSCYRHVLGSASTRWLLTTMGMILFGYIGWLTYFGAYVAEHLGAGANTLSALFLVAGSVQLVTNNLTPAVLARWPMGRLFGIAVVTFAVALLMIGTGTRDLWTVFVAVTALNVGGAVAYIVVNSLLLQASATMRGSVMALSSAATGLGGIGGVTLGGGALAAFDDYGAVYRLLGALVPLALVTFALSARRSVLEMARPAEAMTTGAYPTLDPVQ